MKKVDLINALRKDSLGTNHSGESSRNLNDTQNKPLGHIFPFEDSFYEPESEKPQNIINLIEIKEIKSRFVKKYKAYSSDYTISIKNDALIEDPSKDEQTDLIKQELLKK